MSRQAIDGTTLPRIHPRIDADEHLEHAALTREAIGAVYAAYNEMKFGYQERYYQRAVALELQQKGIPFQREQPHPIHYQNRIIGRYFVDFVIDSSVVLELKVAKEILETHINQVLAYLRHTGLTVGILAVITPQRVLIKRIVYRASEKIRE